MQFRRSLALTTAAVALATTGLSSCGFDYATDRYYTPSVGTNNHDGIVEGARRRGRLHRAGFGHLHRLALQQRPGPTDVSLTEVSPDRRSRRSSSSRSWCRRPRWSTSPTRRRTSRSPATSRPVTSSRCRWLRQRREGRPWTCPSSPTAATTPTSTVPRPPRSRPRPKPSREPTLTEPRDPT